MTVPFKVLALVLYLEHESAVPGEPPFFLPHSDLE